MTTTAGNGVLSHALDDLRAGLSMIPISPDGSKAPDSRVLPKEPDEQTGEPKATWKPFQRSLPTEADLKRWFAGGRRGIAVVCGAVSGNLELIDFDQDAGAIFPQWCDLVEAEAPGLVGRLSVVRTPGKTEPGFHVRYRCPDVPIPGNSKLALDPARPRKEQTLIETRGEGGYALAPGCPPACHPTGRLYVHHSGPPLTAVPTITAAERDVLIRCAAAFDRAPVEDPKPTGPKVAEGPAAGDDFNDRGPSIAEQLKAADWELVQGTDADGKWRRPGKEDPGWSATTGRKTKGGKPVFCVFSTNAQPFPGPSGGRPCSTHDKFGVYAYLNHGGDFAAAARALATKGYGTQKAAGAKQDANGEAPKSRSSAATRLVNFADELLELWHNEDGDGFATRNGTPRETWPLKSQAARQYLTRLFWQRERAAASGETIQAALATLDGKARFDGKTYQAHCRQAEHDGALYLDLGRPDWKAVEVTPQGWRLVEKPPVRFYRPRGLLDLPEPVKGGRVEKLRRFVNVSSDRDWTLLVGWTLAAMRPRGPFPVLSLNGEQGSAKSTAGRLLRRLIDPNKSPLRTTPRTEQDLAIAAKNGWVIALDNLSHLWDWLSDALCRVSTGGGVGTRQLYTDADETLFVFQRPVIVTGIADVITRPDLLDRTIGLQLQTIPEDRRRTEAALWADFDKAAPSILGALLDAVAVGLRELPSTRPPSLLRMADFCVWATACEKGLGWETGAFMAAYRGERSEANETALDASLLVPPLRLFMKDRTEWTGPASDLLSSLTSLAGEAVAKNRDWPSKPHLLSGQLKRLAPNLRRAGLLVTWQRESNARRARTITLKRSANERPGASTASKASETPGFCGRSMDAPGGVVDAPVDARDHAESADVDAVDTLDADEQDFSEAVCSADPPHYQEGEI